MFEDNKFTKEEVQSLLMFYDKFDNIFPEPAGKNEYGEDYWDGKQLFSMILPKITIKTGTIQVKKGEIVDGYLQKDSLESSNQGFIQQIYNAYGMEAIRFYTHTKTITSKWPEGIRSGAQFTMPTLG